MTQPPSKPPPPGTPKLGEVRHDERGQAVWHWAVDTARNAINSTSQLLRKLDLSGLELEGEQSASPPTPNAEPAPSAPPLELVQPDAGKDTRQQAKAVGFNPYNAAKPVAAARPVRATQRVRPEELAARPAPNPRRPESPAPRPSWWRRLLGRD